MHPTKTPSRPSALPAALVLELALTSFCALFAVGSVGCAPVPNSAPARESPAPPRAASDAVAPTPPTPARTVPGPEARAALVAWWLRHDQSYMVIIDAVGEDGRLEARYLNPRPIHVSRAETWTEDGDLRLLIELTDRNYPGNYYELAYHPDRDLLVGLYHHLGNGETYEVYFTRFEDGEESPPL